MNETWKKKLFLLLRLSISFGLIAYIFYKISAKHRLSDLVTYFSDAHYWWLLGAAILLLGLLGAGSFRWGMLLTAQGVRLSHLSVFMYYMMGMFFNNFLPSTVGGDFVKAYYLSRATGKTAGSFISVLIDRLMGMGGLCVVAVAACLLGGTDLYQNPATHPYALPIFLIVGGVSAALVIFFLLVFNDRVMNFFLKLSRPGTSDRARTEVFQPSTFKERIRTFKKHFLNLLRKIGDKIKEFHQAVYIYKGHGKVLGQTLLISTGIWVVIIFVSWMVFMAFHSGQLPVPPGKIPSIPVRYFFLFLPVISVIMSLPISFAGIGTREMGFIIFFSTLPGIKELDALIISLTFYFVYLTVSLLGGVIYIFKDKLHFHREAVAESATPDQM
ncbi:MAG: lysylphosphatidylglycerol synthase transmembrane domain-containing protein [PVC group bacterium]